MKSFITSVVEDVLSKNQKIDNLIFVLPSQRSCVFVKEEVILKLPTNTFLPKIISIENYIQEIAEFSLIDNTQLLFEFYSVYLKVVPEKEQQSFEAFSQWAIIALHDFNEIDNYLVNSNEFFSNLSDLKRLNNWFEDKKPSQLSVNYLQFFDYLHELYKKLEQRLKSNNFGYQGLIYKEAIANLDSYVKTISDNHIVFAGFNALNNAEEQIIQEMLNTGLASIYWDANESMLQKSNEAGVFLRKYKKEWPYFKNHPFLWSFNKTTNQNTKIIGAPKSVSQIKYAGELLSKLDSYSKTALVLADENLLSLSLNSLPSSINAVNITMGFPLKEIPVANLFESIFKLHLNQIKFEKTATNEFYYKDVLNLLNNSFLNKNNGEIFQKICTIIKKENYIFVSVESIKSFLNKNEADEVSYILNLLEFPQNIDKVIEKCLELILALKPHFLEVEKEYLFRFYQVFQQLKTLNTTYNHIKNLKTLSLFYNQILSNEKLSFQGEPLQGLQLMGMLETRVLDFENVIITSLNEGILPAGKGEQSFIPFDIKKFFGLPTYQEKDAIFSYHFQRLIQRAKNVFLIYNTETDGYGSGEKSRFLTKIEINNPTVSQITLTPKINSTENTLLQIEKTEAILARLKEVFTNGISPSALANYIYNPVKFYEQKILKIREEDEVEETIAANTMGTVIHEVLDQMYQPFIGQEVFLKDIENMHKQIDTLLLKNFNKFYRKGSIKTGKNKLIFQVCKSHIKRFLKQEKELLQNNKLRIVDLEPSLSTVVTIEGIDFPIKIVGKIDRIDELNGVTRIIDYKTGKVEAKDLRIQDFSMLSDEYKYTKALQVMLYSFLFTNEKKFNFTNQLEAGIISFKNLNSGFLKMNFSNSKYKKENNITSEKIEEFMVEFSRIVKEILNPEVPFINNENTPF
ncbi:PD-(D/E)XK nuclease superfamily protein [Lutibacter oricola]|uniref:PD-(D/E)XK nuclease superfamily protein n=1 Tax=Lutibacter oricola TaxID=762486 RepID=A0A1H3DA58_9FLAO|nr:PD-(D/E)XK nuclease family protein [Lutibacter oricola]SDX63237.1 PD-(D/E)XK nuclease superfamily protein [Lutibacter oricola]